MTNALWVQALTDADRQEFSTLIKNYEGWKDKPLADLNPQERNQYRKLTQYSGRIAARVQGEGEYPSAAKADAAYVAATLIVRKNHGHLGDNFPFEASCLTHFDGHDTLSEEQVAALVDKMLLMWFDVMPTAPANFQAYLDIETLAPMIAQRMAKAAAKQAKAAAEENLARAKVTKDNPDKLQIEWRAQEPAVYASQCADALVKRNASKPSLFRYGDDVVRVQVDGVSGLATVAPIDASEMEMLVDEVAVFFVVERKTCKYLPTPPAIGKRVMRLVADKLPRLDRIATVPFFTADGRLVVNRGYDAASRSYLAYSADLKITAPSEAPTKEDALRALETLRQPFAEFPYHGPSGLAHTLAAVMQSFIRPMIDGNTAAYLIRKDKRGTGAQLLTDTISIITSGAEAVTTPEAPSDAEYRSTIVSFLLSGQPLLFIDNLHKKISSSVIASLLTARTVGGRVLGLSKWVTLPTDGATVIFAGNRPKATQEILSRLAMITLDTGGVDPEKRTFKIDDLRRWTKDHRGELVSAILTIVAAWIAAGRPAPTPSPKHPRYQAYAGVLGSILSFIDVPGFLADTADKTAIADEEEGGMEALLTAMWESFKDKSVPVGKLAFNAEPDGDPRTIVDLVLEHRAVVGFPWLSKPADKWSGFLGTELSDAAVKGDGTGGHHTIDGQAFRLLKSTRGAAGFRYRLEPAA